MKSAIFGILCLFLSLQASAQYVSDALIVKANAFSLLTRRPNVSIEKFVSPKVSLELSLVGGRFRNIGFTDYYGYSGLLLRAKSHFNVSETKKMEFGGAYPYWGGYVGALSRRIETEPIPRFFSGRYFYGQSVRAGLSAGIACYTQSRIIVDVMAGLGHGRYIGVDRNDPNFHSGGYLDAQFWLSVGYCF